MHQLTILKNLSWLGLYEFISSILGFIFYIVLARTLGEQGLGLYSYLFSFLGLVILFQDLGVNTYFFRKWSTSLNSLKEDITQIISLKVISHLIITPLLFLYVFFLDRHFSLEFLLVYTYFSLDAFRLIPISFSNSQNDFKKSFLINSVERVLSIGLGILLLLQGFSLIHVLFIFILSKLISSVIGYKITQLKIPLRISFSQGYSLILKSTPLFLVELLTTIYFRIDILMIRHMLNLQEVGTYSASYRILETLIIIPGLIATTSLPTLTSLYKSGNLFQVSKIFKDIVRYLTIISLFIAIFFSLYSSEILSFLYGEKFTAGSLTLIILGWTSLFIFISIPFAKYIVAKKDEIFLSKLLIIITLLNIGLNFITIKILGIAGAALVTFFCEILIVVVCVKRAKIPIPLKETLKISVVGLFVALMLYFTKLPLFLALILSLSLYILLLMLFNVIRINKLIRDFKIS